MLNRSFIGAIAALFLTLPSVPSVAQDDVPLTDVATVHLIPGWRTQNGTHMAGLQITLAEGWKTYWRAPGDAGIPPQFDWSGSENLRSVELHWPTPTVFTLNGLKTLAYKDVVVIPIELTPSVEPKGTIALNGRMDFGVCEEICVPVSVRIDAELTAAGGPDATIRRALNDQPTPARSAGVGVVACAISPISDGMRLMANIQIAPQGGDEVVVVELADRSIWVSEAYTERSAGLLTASAEMVPPNGKPFALARSDIRFTVIGDDGAVDIQGCSAG